MHSNTLIEIAAKLASESGTLILGSRQVPEKALERYWLSFKCRLQRWQIDLKDFETELRGNPDQANQIWNRLEPAATEVLQSEVLTRIWSAILNGIEQMCPVKDCDPIGRSTLIGHLEARNRVLRLTMRGQALGVKAAERVNDLRCRIERWTDFLLSMIAQHADVASFGFDQTRVLEYCTERNSVQSPDQKQAFDAICLASVRERFAQTGGEPPPNAKLNDAIAAAVLSSIDSNLFRTTGNLMPLWQTRMLLTTTETCGALEELLRKESEPETSADLQLDRRF